MTNEQRIEKLEKLLAEHQHLGVDGSKEFDGSTFIDAKKINISSPSKIVADYFGITPFSINDAEENIVKEKRAIGIGLTTNDKNTSVEQNQLAISLGKKLPEDFVNKSNLVDFDEVNFSQLSVAHNPQGVSAVSGPSTFPPFAFVYATRTPYIISNGSIQGATLTDNTAKFKNDFTGSYLQLSNLETRRIISNTETTITTDSSFVTNGSYSYTVFTPVFLGSASFPFTRLYVGDDIRLGYGSSGGSQVQYIKWGAGSPEGVVVANIGSLYLRNDGSTSTTLYIKTANNGLSSGWTAK